MLAQRQVLGGVCGGSEQVLSCSRDASSWCSPEHACAVLSFVFNVDSAAEDTHKTKPD